MNDKNTTKPKVRSKLTRYKAVPCPRCYAPLPEEDALCMSIGCQIDRARSV